MNVPLALGVLFTLLKEPKSKDVYALALEFDKIFGLNFDKVTAPRPEPIDVPNEVAALVEKRAALKAAKNWAEADAVRAEITALGYAVMDTKDGPVVTKL